MSRPQLARSCDLLRLRNEGYDVTICDGFLVVADVPYVTAESTIALGKLVCALTLNGDVTTRPADHVMHFVGSTPHQRNGRPLKFINSCAPVVLSTSLTATHLFSSKPPQGYEDYYEKVTAYVSLLENEARAIDPCVTARTFPVVTEEGSSDVFAYTDTASTRAGIAAISQKLAVSSVAIVGLGGTGSYILDFLAKTPVGAIHVYDPDRFLQHNAFRAPGAASITDLEEALPKVDHHARTYSQMHRNIVAHRCAVDETNVGELLGMDFVFLSVDTGPVKGQILRALEQAGTPFIDVGLGLTRTGNSLNGMLRVTTSTPTQRAHVWEKNRIPLPADDAQALYDLNVQVAELNALNAALAVIKWKKLLGFYSDVEREHFSVYAIDGNNIVNEDGA